MLILVQRQNHKSEDLGRNESEGQWVFLAKLYVYIWKNKQT